MPRWSPQEVNLFPLLLCGLYSDVLNRGINVINVFGYFISDQHLHVCPCPLFSFKAPSTQKYVLLIYISLKLDSSRVDDLRRCDTVNLIHQIQNQQILFKAFSGSLQCLLSNISLFVTFDAVSQPTFWQIIKTFSFSLNPRLIPLSGDKKKRSDFLCHVWRVKTLQIGWRRVR